MLADVDNFLQSVDKVLTGFAVKRFLRCKKMFEARVLKDLKTIFRHPEATLDCQIAAHYYRQPVLLHPV